MDTTDRGLSLLKKGQKGFFHAVFSRVGIMIVLLVLQVLFLFMAFFRFAQFLPMCWAARRYLRYSWCCIS